MCLPWLIVEVNGDKLNKAILLLNKNMNTVLECHEVHPLYCILFSQVLTFKKDTWLQKMKHVILKINCPLNYTFSINISYIKAHSLRMLS